SKSSKSSKNGSTPAEPRKAWSIPTAQKSSKSSKTVRPGGPLARHPPGADRPTVHTLGSSAGVGWSAKGGGPLPGRGRGCAGPAKGLGSPPGNREGAPVSWVAPDGRRGP